MPIPPNPKLYHIVHVDKLSHILRDGTLLCDHIISNRAACGTVIGMESIKSRRLSSRLSSHPDLLVGGCVPFYFCPRSIMLYLIYRRNPNLAFQGGQDQVVTLELDLHKTAQWAQQSGLRWAFTLSNAGSYYFEDRSNLGELSHINWDAVQTNRWSGAGIDTSIKDGKQAEFLVEKQVDWGLIERIGVSSHNMVGPVSNVMLQAAYRPKIEVRADWYY